MGSHRQWTDPAFFAESKASGLRLLIGWTLGSIAIGGVFAWLGAWGWHPTILAIVIAFFGSALAEKQKFDVWLRHHRDVQKIKAIVSETLKESGHG